eukprot:12192128-Ditylum_brightwellii.AAC.1
MPGSWNKTYTGLILKAADLLLQWGRNTEDIILEQHGCVGQSLDDGALRKLSQVMLREMAMSM